MVLAQRDQETRLSCLDGIRGIAALIVVLAHIVAALMPRLYWREAGPDLRALFAGSPLSVIYNGAFAVIVFFVLSGLVIAGSASRSPGPFPILVVTRYIRLALPVTASVALAYLWMRIHPDGTRQSGAALANTWLQDFYQPPTPAVADAVSESIFGVYWTGQSWFNPVLWTMRTELLGSIGVYAIYRLMPPHLRLRVLVTVSAALFFATGWGQYFLAFSVGAILHETRQVYRAGRWSALAIASGLVLGAYPNGALHGTLYASMAAVLGPFSAAPTVVRTAGAAALVAGVLGSRYARSFLAARVPQFLGRISFALYLVHFPMLMMGALPLLLQFEGSAPIARLGILGLYLAAATALAWLFTRLVDEPVLAALSRLRRRYRQQLMPGNRALAKSPG